MGEIPQLSAIFCGSRQYSAAQDSKCGFPLNFPPHFRGYQKGFAPVDLADSAYIFFHVIPADPEYRPLRVCGSRSGPPLKHPRTRLPAPPRNARVKMVKIDPVSRLGTARTLPDPALFCICPNGQFFGGNGHPPTISPFFPPVGSLLLPYFVGIQPMKRPFR